ncbi:MAG: T9SS type A sorting domain-containing protein [Chitinophagaceae bacterium]|nr:MAG: T9SS type A sorting domain-containing protein [Chitinophagaceae bacterium]
MKTRILPRIFLTAFAVVSLATANAQQWVIADKDQTRPDPNETVPAASYSSVAAEPFNGYNQITWTAAPDVEATRYLVEYSIDGLRYQTAAEIVATANNGSYSVKHYTQSNEPLLYRIGSQNVSGKMAWSKNFAVDGTPAAPLRIIPNTITGNVLNVNSNWPILRINIFALDGNQVFAKDLNGQRDFIPVAVPQLGKGMYLVSFIGEGWKHTEKILVP